MGPQAINSGTAPATTSRSLPLAAARRKWEDDYARFMFASRCVYPENDLPEIFDAPGSRVRSGSGSRHRLVSGASSLIGRRSRGRGCGGWLLSADVWGGGAG